MRACLALALLVALPAAAPAATLDEALTAYRAGDLATATTQLDALLGAQPDHLAARYWRGIVHSAAERWEPAAADFAAVLAVKPTSLPSRLGLAKALERLGRTDEALDAYRRVLAADPGQTEAVAGVARLAPTRSTASAEAVLARPEPAATSAALAVPPALPTEPLGPAVGPHVGVDSQGLPTAAAALAGAGPDAEGRQLLDYTFGSAPTDWEPRGGVWQITSRFACDPSWSFFGGYSRGLASVWNKRRFAGDQVVEAYVSFKHGLPWNDAVWSYRPSDLCLTLCGDGEDPATGYSFIYAGDDASRTMIRRGDQVLASTTAPEFLTPSYSDVRPSSEEFHRRWWRLEARKTGDLLQFLIDGKLAIEAHDPQPIEAGRVAIWTVHNGMMVARVRIAYQQELRPQAPVVTVAEPLPLPGGEVAVAAVR